MLSHAQSHTATHAARHTHTRMHALTHACTHTLTRTQHTCTRTLLLSHSHTHTHTRPLTHSPAHRSTGGLHSIEFDPSMGLVALTGPDPRDATVLSVPDMKPICVCMVRGGLGGGGGGHLCMHGKRISPYFSNLG